MTCKYVFLAPLFTFLPLLDFYSCQQVVAGRENKFKSVENWPEYKKFGQISAVGVDGSNNVFVFHRGDRQWDQNSFSVTNNYLGRDEGPITGDTIVLLEPSSGSLMTKTGNNLFYLPHGLTIDHENNIWVTDVALHQVFKFPSLSFPMEKSTVLKKPIFSLGVPFEPGSDDEHFCKPTDVAIDKRNNDFYISDGYCNSRIIKYDQYGKKILSFGRTSIGNPQHNFYMLNIPHAIALASDEKVLYVADRENNRVVSYDSASGKFKKTFAEELGSRIFSVAHSNVNHVDGESGLLFVLTNSTTHLKTVSMYGAESGKFFLNFFPSNYFTNPHDLAISTDGQYCYVVELNPYKIWKFKIDLTVILQENHSDDSKAVSPMPDKIVNDPLPNTTGLEGSSTFLAIGLVAIIILISLIFFMFHYTKRKGYRRYEMRRLILDEDDGGDRIALT